MRSFFILDVIRDVNSSLISSAVYDMIEVMKEVDTAHWSELERWGDAPRLLPDGRSIGSRSANEPTNGYNNTCKIGHYGEAFARAMVDVNRVLFPIIAKDVAPNLEGEAVGLMFG